MRPITVRVGPLAAASASAVALAQTSSAGVPLSLNGASSAPATVFVPGTGPGTGFVTANVATLDTVRRVVIASSGNDSGITFALAGTDRAGQVQSEVLIGVNAGSVQSALDYATVTSVVPSGATAANVTVGTTAVASSAWVRLDDDVASQVSIQCVPSGTVSARVEQTVDDPNSPTNPVAPASIVWIPHPSAEGQNITGAGGPIQTNYTVVPIFARVTIASGTGSVVATFAQTGRQSPS